MLKCSMVGLSLALLAGCGQEGGPRRVSFPVEVQAATASGLANDHGYTVAIDQARLSLGPITWYSGEPLFSRGPPRSRWPNWIRGLSPIGTAHAHPGHYQEGQALAELRGAVTVDLLADRTALGVASGLTGQYRSARLDLAPPSGSTATATIGGTAKKSNESITFSAEIALTTAVKGVPVGATINDGDGTLVLRVDLKPWVDRIDFAALASGSGPVTVPRGSQAENALLRGITSTSAFVFSWKLNSKVR